MTRRRAIYGLGALFTAIAVLAIPRFILSAETDFGRTPVLFVHGHGLYATDWSEVVEHLENKGYPRAYLHALQIEPNRASNVVAAREYIAPAVERLLADAREAATAAGERFGRDRVDIVAHSMGTVSSRWYATQLRPERVRTWISVAGANHGTNALCNHTDDGAAEMCPAYDDTGAVDSVQATLNGTPFDRRDESPYGLGVDPAGKPSVPADARRNILYLTIRIEPDSWIVPAGSATLAGAGGTVIAIPEESPSAETSTGNFLLRRDVDHMSILDDPDFLDLVHAMLTARDMSR